MLADTFAYIWSITIGDETCAESPVLSYPFTHKILCLETLFVLDNETDIFKIMIKARIDQMIQDSFWLVIVSTREKIKYHQILLAE